MYNAGNSNQSPVFRLCPMIVAHMYPSCLVTRLKSFEYSNSCTWPTISSFKTTATAYLSCTLFVVFCLSNYLVPYFVFPNAMIHVITMHNTFKPVLLRDEVNRQVLREPNLSLPPGKIVTPIIHTGDQPTLPARSGGGIEHLYPNVPTLPPLLSPLN